MTNVIDATKPAQFETPGWVTAGRWVLLLPAAFLALFVGFALSRLVGLFGFFGDSTAWWNELAASAVAGWAYVDVAARTAPSNKRYAGIGAASLLIVLLSAGCVFSWIRGDWVGLFQEITIGTCAIIEARGLQK